MKFREIKNMALGELTILELGWFLKYLEGKAKKYLSNSPMVTMELFSDLSGWIRTSGEDHLVDVDGGETPIRDLKWKAISRFKEMGKLDEEERKRIEELTRKQDWEYDFIIQGINQSAAEELMKQISAAVDAVDGVEIGGGFHKFEYDDEIGKRE